MIDAHAGVDPASKPRPTVPNPNPNWGRSSLETKTHRVTPAAHRQVPGVGGGRGSMVLVLGTSNCYMYNAAAQVRVAVVAGVMLWD